MLAPARERLTVFEDGNEVPGIIFYGLRRETETRAVTFPSSTWGGQSPSRSFSLEGRSWRVEMWELPLVAWPRGLNFVAAVRETLEAMINGGSRVAWVGAEGLPFCDPPEALDPNCMSGGVLAWMKDDGTFECPLDPDSPISVVSDDEMVRLRTYAAGLADAE